MFACKVFDKEYAEFESRAVMLRQPKPWRRLAVLRSALRNFLTSFVNLPSSVFSLCIWPVFCLSLYFTHSAQSWGQEELSYGSEPLTGADWF